MRTIFGFCVAVVLGSSSLQDPATRSYPTDTRPALPFPDRIKPVTVCGDKDETQHVEMYKGDLGVAKKYVETNEPSTVQLQWLDMQSMARSSRATPTETFLPCAGAAAR